MCVIKGGECDGACVIKGESVMVHMCGGGGECDGACVCGGGGV